MLPAAVDILDIQVVLRRTYDGAGGTCFVSVAVNHVNIHGWAKQ